MPLFLFSILSNFANIGNDSNSPDFVGFKNTIFRGNYMQLYTIFLQKYILTQNDTTYYHLKSLKINH
nr:MAG TPA: hypothetical protein [Caudoviricetes sp.]